MVFEGGNMSRKVILTLCLLLLIAVVWSENRVEIDFTEIIELIRHYEPAPKTIQRLVGNWNDKSGNSVIFDSEGNCRLKKATDRDFDNWKLRQNKKGIHYITYYKQNGCSPIMKQFFIAFIDDGQTLMLKWGEEEYQLTKHSPFLK